MELIILLPLIAIGAFIYKYFAGRQVTVTENSFKQNGVLVTFNDGKIKIGKHVYNAKQVTNIRTVTHPNASNVFRAATAYVKIEVDDFKRPVHQLTIIGGERAADKFTQRLCVAIRKAGGPDFY